MFATLRSLGPIALVCLTAAACEERAGNLPILERTPTAPHRAAEPAPAPAAAYAAPLSDAQSVDALGTLNHGEIDLARYALERARTAPARELAQMMIDQHSEAEANVTAWAQDHRVTGQPNDVTPAVLASASAMRTRLEYASDDAFDRAYVQGQIEMHSDALAILDERIVPGATDPDFRRLVTEIRGAVATHLEHARQTLAQMPQAGAPIAAGEPTPH